MEVSKPSLPVSVRSTFVVTRVEEVGATVGVWVGAALGTHVDGNGEGASLGT